MGAPFGIPVRVTATAVVAAVADTMVRGVTVGVAAAGQTLKLHDCATTGAAASGNCKATIALDTVLSHSLHDAKFAVGVVAVVSGGTPDITVVIG